MRLAERLLDECRERERDAVLLAERTRDRGLPTSDPDDDEFLCELAASAVVVLKRGLNFPVAQPPASVALIGPTAVSACVLGGGRSTVNPVQYTVPA